MSAIIARPRTNHNLIKRAFLRAALYMGLCSIYIVYSSRWVAASAASAADIERFEVTKGVLFVVVTGILFFIFSLVWLKRVERRDRLLIASERRDVAAQCGAVLAHDVNNLLMTLNGLTDELRSHPTTDPALAPLFKELDQTVAGLSALAKRLAATATRAAPAGNQRIVLEDWLPGILALAAKHPAVRSCSFCIDPLPAATLRLDPDLFEQAILNLVINAAQAAPRHTGRLLVAVEIRDNQAVVDIHDNGPGVPPDQVETILSPGYTTKPDGSGLGLLSVQALVRDARGTLEITRSDRLAGALFRLKLPLA